MVAGSHHDVHFHYSNVLFLSWDIFELDMSVCLLLEMAFLFLPSFLSWNLFYGGFGV